ncbi:hypothetical protein TIFTF001_037500 [Ficus carica]|uniref:Uncharacterized protein n=1 Tax=Ficus carica TaxID=3494 RepID=A0AA88E5F3_FICCA|nr:hypothetical protein TIFTF001_037488 [Ficus carica]GMN68447.1 hypothetical protein TIFTF001_037500 [Ficus carica]
MDSSNSSRRFLSGIEVMLSFLLIIIIMTLVSNCISFFRTRRLPGVLPHCDTPYEHKLDVESGLDEATLGAFPKLLYSKANTTLTSDGKKYYSSAL